MPDCKHVNRVCKMQHWGDSNGTITVKGVEKSNYHAQVDLWHCNDCNAELMYDWHTQRLDIAKHPSYVTDEITKTVWYPESRPGTKQLAGNIS